MRTAHLAKGQVNEPQPRNLHRFLQTWRPRVAGVREKLPRESYAKRRPREQGNRSTKSRVNSVQGFLALREERARERTRGSEREPTSTGQGLNPSPRASPNPSQAQPSQPKSSVHLTQAQNPQPISHWLKHTNTRAHIHQCMHKQRTKLGSTQTTSHDHRAARR